MRRTYSIVSTNKDGTTCTMMFDNEEEFNMNLELCDECVANGDFIKVVASVEIEQSDEE